MAQVVVKHQCGLCASNDDVNSYCKECAQNVCEKCEKKHMVTFSYHSIIPLFDGFLMDKSVQTKCLKHYEFIQFHCKKCRKNICMKCLKKDHNKHEMESIGDNAKKLIASFTKEISEELIYVEKTQGQIENDIKDYEKNLIGEIHTQIASVEEEARKRVNKLRQKEKEIIDLLKSHETAVKVALNDEIQNNQRMGQNNKLLLESLKAKTKYIPDAGVLQFVHDSKAKLPSTSMSNSFEKPGIPSFKPSNIWTQGKDILGTLEFTKRHSTVDMSAEKIEKSSSLKKNAEPIIQRSSSLRRKLEIVRQISPDPRSRRIDSVRTAEDGSCWVGIYTGYETGENTGDVVLLKSDGSVQLTVHLSHTADHTVLTSDGDLLVSGCTSDITRVNKYGGKNNFRSGSSVCRVFGLAVTQDGGVFVCYRMPSDSKDEIFKLNEEGEELFKLDPEMLISDNIFGIHSTSRDTICVQDGVYGGRLVFVDKDGHFVRSIVRMESLQENLKDLVWDRYGYMLAGTLQAEYIHVFSDEGTCLKTYHVKGSGRILGLAVCDDNTLWIGTKSGKLIVAKFT